MKNKTATRGPGRPRAFDEGEVLRQAQHAFLLHGFEGAPYEAVADAVGLSKPSLYNAFGDKTAMFERALADYAHGARQQIVASFIAGDSLTDGGRKLLLAAADVYAPPTGPSTGCLLVGTALPACAQRDSVRHTLTAFIADLEADLAQAIVTHYAADASRARKTPRMLALNLSSLLFSLAVRARTGLTRRKLRDVAVELGSLIP